MCVKTHDAGEGRLTEQHLPVPKEGGSWSTSCPRPGNSAQVSLSWIYLKFLCEQMGKPGCRPVLSFVHPAFLAILIAPVCQLQVIREPYPSYQASSQHQGGR